MANRIATIARYTVLEAIRTRLPLLTVVVAGLFIAASLFVRGIAIAESERFQTAFYAGTMRLAAVFIIALYVIASVARELQDKGLDVVLALDLPRGHYIVGKLAGFVTIAAVLAFAVSLPLFALASPPAVLEWAVSLALELAIVAAFSLFCAVMFNQLMPAASVVFGLYLLGRTLTAMRLIGENPIAGATTASHKAMTWLVEALAYVIPALDGWTRTAWLVDAPATGMAIARIAGESALFVTLIGAAAVFDMYRKNF